MQIRKIFLSGLVGVMLLAACGGDDEPTPEPTATPVPATATQAPTATPIPATPTTETASATDAADIQAAGTSEDQQPAQEAYPAPEQSGYPSPNESSSTNPAVASSNVVTSSADIPYPPPAPVPTEAPSRIPVVPFVLERPVVPGSTVIRGTGPADIPILIVDVGFMGEMLGEGIIDKDGKFEIEVPPLVENSYIGVAVGELEGTGLDYSDFWASGFNGPQAEQVPQVGFIYDSLIVKN